MKAIKLTKDIPHEALSKGDVLNVDELSALSMIDRGVAEEYAPPKASAKSDAKPARYGGQDAETIDDIVDPEARGGRIVNVRVVGDPDMPGGTGKQTRSRGRKPARGAPGAKPAGGDPHEEKSTG